MIRIDRVHVQMVAERRERRLEAIRVVNVGRSARHFDHFAVFDVLTHGNGRALQRDLKTAFRRRQIEQIVGRSATRSG